jgi:hypothetical protein
MISDTLSDAVAAIRRYQRRMPEVYGQLEIEIARVIVVMDELRVKLDSCDVECVNGGKFESGQSH